LVDGGVLDAFRHPVELEVHKLSLQISPTAWLPMQGSSDSTW
jgi:hypothetical protein